MQTDQIIIYQTTEGQTAIDVKLENETVWLSLNQIADLFERNKSTISRHIANILEEEELDQETTVAKNATFISVGYRVNSKRGTQFRIWANKVLNELPIKVINLLPLTFSYEV